MKIHSKIGDGIFISLLVLCLLTMFFCIVWVLVDVWIPAVVFFAILTIVVIPIYFGTYYRINQDALYINCGLFLINYRIDYSKIVSMTDVEKYNLAPALSYHRVCIRFIQGDNIKSILVSPSDKDKFKKLVHDQISLYMANNKNDTIDQDTNNTPITTPHNNEELPITNITPKQNKKILAKLEKRMKNAENIKEYQEMQKAVHLANINLNSPKNANMFDCNIEN